MEMSKAQICNFKKNMRCRRVIILKDVMMITLVIT